jgi:lysophospholipase L1-like esterase
MARVRHFTALSVIAAGAVVLTLMVLEGVARFAPLWPDLLSDYDPELGVAHLPGARGWWVNIAYPLEIRSYVEISSQGLHDREFARERSSGTTRILFLGDSFVDALEVPLDKTPAKQLERLFVDSGRNVEILNGGHYGWGTDRELLFFRLRGVHFDPDLVLLGFTVGNDFSDNTSSTESPIGPKPYFRLDSNGAPALHNFPVPEVQREPSGAAFLKPLKRFLYAHSKLYRFCGFHLRETLLPALRSYFRRREKVAPPPSGVANRELTAALLARLRDEVEATGARFVTVILPWSRAASPEWRELESYQEITAICARHDIECVDLMPLFGELMAANPDAELFFPRDGHPTAAGHRQIARALYDDLSSRPSLWRHRRGR